jgi:hypothetical protein
LARDPGSRKRGRILGVLKRHLETLATRGSDIKAVVSRHMEKMRKIDDNM